MGERVLCLGSGAVTGAAWQLGVLAGLAEAGADVSSPDLLVGTSAGALLGAHLLLGRTADEIRTLLWDLDLGGRMTPLALAALGAAQVWPSRRHAVLWLGRRSMGRDWSETRADGWVKILSVGLTGEDWPQRLVIVASDVETGRPAYFTARDGIPLERAVAASCALPGVFPPVLVDGRPHMDGAVRSPANIDLAAGGDVVVAIAPLGYSMRAHARPYEQAKLLARSAEVVLIEPDAAARVVIGYDITNPAGRDAAMAAGREAGLRRADEVRKAWQATEAGRTSSRSGG